MATSVVCELEFRSFPGLDEADLELFESLLSRIAVIGLDSDNLELKKNIVQIRLTKKVKLPDAIIAASSVVNNCRLLTADLKLQNLEGIPAIGFSPI